MSPAVGRSMLIAKGLPQTVVAKTQSVRSSSNGGLYWAVVSELKCTNSFRSCRIKISICRHVSLNGVMQNVQPFAISFWSLRLFVVLYLSPRSQETWHFCHTRLHYFLLWLWVTFTRPPGAQFTPNGFKCSLHQSVISALGNPSNL